MEFSSKQATFDYRAVVLRCSNWNQGNMSRFGGAPKLPETQLAIFRNPAFSLWDGPQLICLVWTPPHLIHDTCAIRMLG